MGKVLTPDALLTQLQQCRQLGKRIVTTNGCFDVLHVGHLRYLQAAKEQGDVLVILLNSDTSVQQLKGENRPIVPEEERAEILAALTCVDYVTLFEAKTPVSLLKQIRPDVHVKGGEYDPKTLPEAPVLEAMGAKLTFIPMVAGRSTTSIIERILHVYHQPV